MRIEETNIVFRQQQVMDANIESDRQTFMLRPLNQGHAGSGRQAGQVHPAAGIAHQLANPFDEDLVYLAVGPNDAHEVCTYPDSGKVMVRSLKTVGYFEKAAYMHGEPGMPRILEMARAKPAKTARRPKKGAR